MSIKQLSIFIENKTGRIAEISKILADGNVNIRALSIADTTGFGILRMIVADPAGAIEVCKKANLLATLTDAVAILMDDVAGGFATVMEAVSNAGISVEYIYAFLTPTDKTKACIIICVSDIAAATERLKQMNIKTLSGEEIYSM